MGNKKIRLVIIALLIIFVGFVSYVRIFYTQPSNEVVILGINQTRALPKNVSYPPTKIITACAKDSDCAWISTNCCPPNAGAYWQCLNKKSYIDCKSKLVLCPQVLSPKPTIPCKCMGGKCSAA